MDIELNANNVNAAIKANILKDKKMRAIGFTDCCKDKWYFCKGLGSEISFNLTIPKDGSDISIDVLDERFGQPYDYQYVLRVHMNDFALDIMNKVEDIMQMLTNKGIIYGWKRGDYI